MSRNVPGILVTCWFDQLTSPGIRSYNVMADEEGVLVRREGGSQTGRQSRDKRWEEITEQASRKPDKQFLKGAQGKFVGALKYGGNT